MYEHETSVSLFGEGIDAMVQYEPDPDPDGGGNDVLITSVVIRRCTHERGDMMHSPSGSYLVTFPQFAKVEIMPVLLGKQIAELARQILAEKAEEDWDEVMNPRKGYAAAMPKDFPPQFPGVPL